MNELFLKVRELYKKEGGKFPEPILNLTWNYGKTDQHPQRRQGDQRLLSRGCVRQEGHAAQASRQEGRALRHLRPSAGRRDHLLRQLALQPELHAERRQGHQHDGPARQERSHGTRALSRVGLGMAGEPQDHLQPRVRGPERQSLGPETAVAQVGPEQGGPGHQEAGRLGGRRARRSGAAHGQGHRQVSLHHDVRRQGRASTAPA